MEPLLLGVWLAYVRISKPWQWAMAQRMAPGVLAGAILLLLVMQFSGSSVWMYRLGFTALALGVVSLLVLLVEREAGKLASSAAVKGIALASYSIYLTHALMIDAMRMLMQKFPGLPWLIYFPLVLLLIAVAGVAFYFGVEWTSVLLRDRWVPRRTKTERACVSTAKTYVQHPSP
jgi:peptidoglycan/LPS O-acetylase OafA/YrhL